MNKIIKSYNKFLNEGQKEQKKIDELLDKGVKNLTSAERALLDKLSAGGSLPEESRATLQTHKTGGGYLFDDSGDVLTDEEPEDKPGEEFVTSKGKQRSVDKIGKTGLIDARIYRNKDNDDRRIYSYTTTEVDGAMTPDWIIYRTGGGDAYPFGQFLDTNAPKYNFYKRMTPEMLWQELDSTFDYGMILDDDLYEDFINFVELYKENQKRNAEVLQRLKSRFMKLL